MDLRALPSLTSPVLGSAARPVSAGRAVSASGPGASFQAALQSVSAAQEQAGRLQRAVVSGEPGASLEQTMLAMQKAQIGFQSALHVRNRMVQAYTDIMNMQV